jgi:hypothetical protein
VTVGEFKKEMTSLFRMSDLGLLSYYLGIEVIQHPGCIRLRQSAYADKLLAIMEMGSCNAATVPMEPCLKLSKKGSGTAVDPTLYRSIVGGLCSCYAVGYPRRFMKAPVSDHWSVVKHLLRWDKEPWVLLHTPGEGDEGQARGLHRR